MAVNIYPAASTGLAAFSIDVPFNGSGAWGSVAGSAGTYEITFFPIAANATASVSFLDAGNFAIGGANLFDVDNASTANELYGRAIVTGAIASVSIQSTVGGWALIRQLNTASNVKQINKLVSSGTIVLAAQARVLVIGGGGGGGPERFNAGAGGGGGGSGYWNVGTLNAGTYSYTIGGGGAAGNGDSTKSGDGGTTTISTISASGGQGGYNGYFGATGGSGGSGGGGGSSNLLSLARGGQNGANGQTPLSGGAGGVGSGNTLEGWTGNAPRYQGTFGAAGSFAQGGAGGTVGTLDNYKEDGIPSTGGGGGGTSRQFGSNLNGSNGASGAIYYYYV